MTMVLLPWGIGRGGKASLSMYKLCVDSFVMSLVLKKEKCQCARGGTGVTHHLKGTAGRYCTQLGLAAEEGSNTHPPEILQ